MRVVGLLRALKNRRAQLRNPIHAMYGAVTQLASGTLDVTGTAVALETLTNCIELMVGVTNNLLDAEALRRGALRVQV